MKTHRMYRQSRPEVPNILVLKPGVNYVPAEYLEGLVVTPEIKRQRLTQGTWIDDPYKAPEQAIAYVDEAAPFDEAEFERIKIAFLRLGHVSPAEIGEVKP